MDVWEETFDVIRHILGLKTKKTTLPPKPPPLEKMNVGEWDIMQNVILQQQARGQMNEPGAMALDTRPLPQMSIEEEKALIKAKNDRGITHRPDNVVNISEFPEGSLFP